MNDTELDRLLNTWEAPAPPPSLRNGLRARFPRAERRRLVRPLRWLLVIAVASVMLAVGLGQTGGNTLDFRLVRIMNQWYENLLDSLDASQVRRMVKLIHESEPKVYVDGQLIGPLDFGPAARMDVDVPGEGVYSVISFRRRLAGWVDAGRIHGNLIEFQAGGKQVRIECNKPIVDSDRPVFALRRP